MALPYMTAKTTSGGKKKKATKKASKGYHRMPNGKLMKGAKHSTKKNGKK